MKHRNSGRSSSLENSAVSEFVIRLILNAVFEEIVFSCLNPFSVIFNVKIYRERPFQTQNTKHMVLDGIEWFTFISTPDFKKF